MVLISLKVCLIVFWGILNFYLLCTTTVVLHINIGYKLLTSKEPNVLREHNLNFNRLCKLEKWSNEAEILVCGGQPSYLSNKTILTQNKFTVNEL